VSSWKFSCPNGNRWLPHWCLVVRICRIMVVIPAMWTSFLSSCFMQLVSDPKVNHQEPLSLQVVCNQDNHSLWLKQVTDRLVWVLQFTWQWSLQGEQCPLLCIALIWCLSKLLSPCSNFSCSCTLCVLYCHSWLPQRATALFCRLGPLVGKLLQQSV